MRNYSYLWPLTAVLVPYVIFEALNMGVLKDLFFNMPKGHFYIVSLVSILASVISIAVGISGRRIRNIKISFLSLSLFSLGLMFSVHGLSTPNYIHGFTHLPGISAQLSMLLATFWIWLSSLPSDHAIVEFFSRRQRSLLPIWTVTLGIFCVIGMMYPHMVDIVPLDAEPLNFIITIAFSCCIHYGIL
jgi:hypothetical protein